MNLRRWLSRMLPSRETLRKATVLVGGATLGQALVVLASPMITRLYTPDDLGIVTVYGSILNIALVVASLRYELAIPLPSDEEDAINLVAVGIFSVAVTGGITWIFTTALSDQIVQWAREPGLRPYLWMLPLGLVGGGIYQVLTYWALREKAIRTIAKTKVSRSVAQVGTQIGVGLLHKGPLGLLLGQLMGQTGGIAALGGLLRRDQRGLLRTVSWYRMLSMAVRYRRFPLVSSGAALINAVGLQVPVLLLTTLYSTRVAGWYGLGLRAVSLPMALIGTSVAELYVGRAAELVRNAPKQLQRVFAQTTKRLFMVGVGPMLFLGLTGPWLFGFVFGDKWVEAGVYVQLLVIMLLVQFAVNPLSQTLILLERHELVLWWSVGRLVLAIAAIAVVYAVGGTARMAIGVYSAAMTLSYLVMLILCLYAIQIHVRRSGDSTIG